MLASQPRIQGHHSPCSTRTRSIALAPCSARQLSIPRKQFIASVGNGSVDNEDQKKADDLSERILSGEFTDSGSTKEKLTRPVRKLLAQDPVGIGEQAGLGDGLSQAVQQAPTRPPHTRNAAATLQSQGNPRNFLSVPNVQFRQQAVPWSQCLMHQAPQQGNTRQCQHRVQQRALHGIEPLPLHNTACFGACAEASEHACSVQFTG